MAGSVFATTEFVSACVFIGSTILGVFAVATRYLWKTMRRLNYFFGDFYGEPPRAGVPAKPGVIERIGNLELAAVDNQKLIQQVLQETKPNGGSTMRDEIKQVHKMVTKQGVDDVEYRK